MALKPLQAIYPLGQFDGYDSDTRTVGALLGGEVATLVNYAFSGTTAGTDQAAADADGSDGYVGTTIKYRPIATKALPDGARPVFLLDEGCAGYGTLFGELIGAVVGKAGSGPGTGVQMGPPTSAGSGKVTLWDKAGLYAVTLDAVDTTALTGLVPGNTTLDVGDPLYATSAGLLTPDVTSSFDTANLVVARFVEFSTNGSLVTTPNYLVAAANSPSGSLGAPAQVAFTQAVVHFDPEY